MRYIDVFNRDDVVKALDEARDHLESVTMIHPNGFRLEVISPLDKTPRVYGDEQLRNYRKTLTTRMNRVSRSAKKIWK